MHVKILGSAAGGGFPQWNCACENCRSLREGMFSGKPRTQLQVAVSADSQSWVLLNASPDLRSQVEKHSALHPHEGKRSSPIFAVILTSAELDQVLGLLSLREFQPIQIYATPSVQKILREDNTMFAMLNRVYDQATWIDIIPGQTFSVGSMPPEGSGLRCEPISLAAHFPSYVSAERCSKLSPNESLLGLILEDKLGSRLAYFPAIPAIDNPLLEHLASTNVILADGTFWSDDELRRVRGEGPTSRQIGHVPITGDDGSLRQLSSLSRERKIFVHINNTNPVLNESGVEYRQVREAGWEVAEDGWEFTL